MSLPRWTSLLLRVFPQEFREAHRAEVEDFVREELEDAGPRALWVALRLGWDLSRAGVSLRLRPVRREIWASRTSEGGEGWIMGALSDLRLAVRGLARSGGFSAVVIATLALGVGLNTALFSVVNAVVLRPLEYAEPDRLVHVASHLASTEAATTLSGGDVRDLRAGASGLVAVEGVTSIRQNLNGAGLPRQIHVGWVSPGFLDMLGVPPLLGRVHDAEDAPGTVVLSHRLWVEAFGADPGALGRAIQLDGHPATVVGVMPEGFRLRLATAAGVFPDVDLWKNPDAFWQNGDVWGSQGPQFRILRVVGRLAPSATPADAQGGVDAVVADLRRRFPEYETERLAMTVEPLQGHAVAEVRPTLMLLFGAVVLVLLIACANVANLLTVRGHARARELAIRLALGSPRSRVGRFMLLESLVLAVVGAGGGLLLALWAVSLAPRLAPPQLPLGEGVALDGTVLAFAAALALATTVLVGVLPAVAALRTDPSRELGNGRTLGSGASTLRDGLVVAQVALSLMLLVGAGLLMSSVMRLQSVEPGFDPSATFTFGVSIPGARYGWPEEAGAFYREVESRVASLPGVSAAGVVWPMPFGGTWGGPLNSAEGEEVDHGQVNYRLATEAYFPTVRIPLVDGRLFRDGDARHVVVVSSEVAERMWPGRSAIGQGLKANPWGGGGEVFEVIGVVGSVRDQDLREGPQPTLYFDARSWSWVDWEVHVVARTELEAEVLVPRLREEVAGLDAAIPVADPGWLSDLLGSHTATTRFVLLLLGVFALTAVALALIGLYGVVSYSVGLRRREFGVRIALGSASLGIQRMVVGRGLLLAGLGVAFGLAGAWLLAGVLESLLFGVTPTDPETYAGVALALVGAALAASWLPAWRASRLDPVEALRSD